MNPDHPSHADVIDRCQNHVPSASRVRRHYLQHEYADVKREAWKVLGAKIEAWVEPRANLSRTRRVEPEVS